MLLVLRIKRADTVTLELRGQVMDPWAEVLDAEGRAVVREGQPLEIDLTRVTLVSARGLEVLGSLRRMGARITGSPLIEGMIEDDESAGDPGDPEA